MKLELKDIEKKIKIGPASTPKPQENKDEDDSVTFTPQVTIDDDFEKGVGSPVKESTTTIAEYIRSIYKYMLAVVGLLAAVVLMISGVIWLTAGGNTERISQAKNYMTGSLTGLVLMLTSYIILRTVNPNMVEFKISPIPTIAAIEPGCCQYNLSDGTTTSRMLTSIDCYNKVLESETNLDEISFEKLEEKYNNDMAKYLNTKGVFFKDKIGEYGKTCAKPTYCHVRLSKKDKLVSEAVLLLKNKNSCIARIKNPYGGISRVFNNIAGVYNIKAVKYENKEELKENNLSNLLNVCSNHRDGSRCEGTGLAGIQCWCYDGAPWFGNGSKYEPCGRVGTCAPKDEGNKRNITIKDTRDCDTGLRCYKNVDAEY
jgi:hypothetical protein